MIIPIKSAIKTLSDIMNKDISEKEKRNEINKFLGILNNSELPEGGRYLEDWYNLRELIKLLSTIVSKLSFSKSEIVIYERQLNAVEMQIKYLERS